ncbi:cytosolic sulfotransferase 12-like [Neltuma alba]|uniref:cytosolic sulfotransferase 12-like n=1 Tax=Neltuma alba TaxID=207710 RepID=UPI0010A57FCF|nr:cytosolic sulfotransferase 12-like [Prosopis alba]
MTAENYPRASDLTVVPKKYEEAGGDLHQDFQDLIATLPRPQNRIGLEEYQGFWFPKVLMQGVLKCQNQFQARDSDILLATSPKSGTTRLKALVFAIINRNTRDPICSILNTNPHSLVPFLEVLLQHENTSNLNSFPSPRIFSSHIPYVSLPESMKQSRCKIVYLCGNPNDLFVSLWLWHFLGKLKPETQGPHSVEDSCEEFCREVSIYGPFWDHMLGYYKESSERPWKILFLRFEELKEGPVKTLKQLADFIGYGISQEEENGDVVGNLLKLCDFENLSSLEVNRTGSTVFGLENKLFFRRGEVGDWKNHLSIDMVKRLNAITQEKLEKHGLKS